MWTVLGSEPQISYFQVPSHGTVSVCGQFCFFCLECNCF
jgi:hypothetical protein